MTEDKIIEKDLPFDLSTAINILSNAIDKPTKHFFPDLGLGGSDLAFQGIITGNHFKVWTREARRGPAPAFIEGDIEAVDMKSRLKARIKILSFCRAFSFSPRLLAIIVFVVFISFIFAMIGLTMSLQNSISIAFPIFMISMFLLLMSLANYKGKQEQEELEGFINKLFGYRGQNNEDDSIKK